MMRILEGESLLNDASGLVCFRFAVAAMMTGVFSFWGAALDFVWVSLGGIAVGITLTLALTWIKNVVSQRLGEQLHGVASRATDTVQLTGHTHPSWLAGYVIAITLGLATLRFAWLFVSLRLALFHGRVATNEPTATSALTLGKHRFNH